MAIEAPECDITVRGEAQLGVGCVLEEDGERTCKCMNRISLILGLHKNSPINVGQVGWSADYLATNEHREESSEEDLRQYCHGRMNK